jgi:2-oxoglutarate ferredoxin oxidoreductase subunit alpha
VAPAKLKSGEYRQISGNTALAYGLVTAAQLANTQVVLGTYPITPASDILHELSKYKHFNVLTFQAEDEIAGVGAALGASYGGALGVTSTSGPGIALKAEAIGLGVMMELPLVVVDVQRGGPSTGLPTKTEQADLLQVLYGRNGESPVAVIAPATPSDCFDVAVEAARIALTYRTPVILLSDGAIANGSEPWRIPDITTYEPISHTFAKPDEPFEPYARDPQTLARQFAVPGTPGLEHRIGGLEKANGSGNISYEPKNHDLMVRLRQAKIDGITVPDLEVDDPTGDAELLLVGWGSSYGPIGEACRRARRKGFKVAHAHIRYLNPFPANLGEVLKRYSIVVLPEMNLGQLALLLRGKYLVDIQSVTKVEGMAFLADEVEGIIDAALDGTLAEKETDKAKFARLAAATVDTGVGVDE